MIMLKQMLAAAIIAGMLVSLGAIDAIASPATEVEGYLNGLATWSADFTQTIDDGHGKIVRSAAGKLYLQKPGRFRWDYSQPSEQLILADGKQIWFYDKDLGRPTCATWMPAWRTRRRCCYRETAR